MEDQERACWVAFNRTPGVGAARFRRLLAFFGTLETAWRAPRRDLALAGLDKRTLDAIEVARGNLDAHKELARAHRLGAQVLTWRDESYPRSLAAIPDPPPVLYVRGGLDVTAGALALAIVGTRRPTAYGRDIAERLSSELAGAGVTVISGLAKGIDTHAHRGALAGGGRTIAVLGHGIDRCYPPENRGLASQIVECGALVTEYAVGVGPLGENFPPRNRIISGLAAGVLVVEAGQASGALITSAYAAEQGRDVFAVPGPITSYASRGCHQLIQDGAKLITTADDVLGELNPHLSPAVPQQLQLDLAGSGEAAGAPGANGALAGTEPNAGLLARLGEIGEPAHVDQLARICGRPVQEISGSLTLLEVQGRVRHLGGMRYALVRR